MSDHPSPKRILLVEDYVDTRELYADALRNAGYAVDEAADGAAAVQLAIFRRPDLVLLDVGLPGVDGFEVAHDLRRRAGLKDVPIVLVSAFVLPHNANAFAAKAQALFALPKPCLPEDLLAAVRRVFGVSADA